VGTASPTTPLTVQLWLRPRAGAEAAASAISTPGSSRYHHFLSPRAYAAAYGADDATVAQVRTWLTRQGFSHVRTDARRSYVTGQAPVATAQKAFSVTIKRYRVPAPGGGTQTVTSNDREVAVPASFASQVTAVTGLDSFQPVPLHTSHHTAARAAASVRAAATTAPPPCATYYGQRFKSGLPTFHGGNSFPFVGCGYNARQLRAAYGLTGSRETGAGQTIAYVEVGTPYKMMTALTRFAKVGGLPAPKSTSYRQLAIGRGDDCGNPFDVEEQLDVEAGYAMAPGARHLLVGGDSCNSKRQGVQAILDADLAVLDGNGAAPLATIVSNSWGLSSESTPGNYGAVLHSILVRAAAEGVGMYFASGDDPGVAIPANDPYAIAVGGTTLGIGSKDQRVFETGWSDKDLYIAKTRYVDWGIGRNAAGGGTSLLWKQPAYQQGVVPATDAFPSSGDLAEPRRAVPDIAALADAFTGIQQIDVAQDEKGRDFYDVFPDGGTSLASPLVAGIVAVAQQGGGTLGFANPALYSLAGTSALHDVLPVTASTPPSRSAVYCPPSNDDLCGDPTLEVFDSQDRTYTDQSTRKGYDTMTGIGTPNGQAFVTALRALAAAQGSGSPATR
jgi:subtilase family serine protease